MSLQAGHKLAHYEILEPIGKGGMGEVYRAKDGKLGREVAIKVLPDEFAQDEERLRRFQREAKVLASLNHPNIASIYGLEQSGDTHYLVLELVPGETLAERIARGPIPVEEALEIAKKIAEALEEAHEQGIVHRDLKPANVKLTPDDKVKVLDFGLAKAFVEEGPEGDAVTSMSPTITRDATRVGIILGTAAYMSPEQAKGKRVDKRTDIWAFGAVVYEMLTAKKAFPGDDVSEVLASVIKSEPDWNALSADVPAGARKLLRRCLEKHPNQRLHDIADGRIEIGDVRDGDTHEAFQAASFSYGRGGWVAAAFLFLSGIVAASVVWNFWPDEEGRAVTRLGVTLPATDGLDLSEGTALSVALSSDGRTLAYSASRDGIVQIFLRPLDRPNASVVPGTEGGKSPFFSPDGRWLGFFVGSQLKKAPLDGGSPLTLCPTPGMWSPAGTWSADGWIYFTTGLARGLFRVAEDGGSPERIGTSDVDYREPELLPGGKHLLLTIGRQVATRSLDTGEERVLFAGRSARLSPSGHLVFGRRGSLWAISFDPVRLEASGTPQLLSEKVHVSAINQFHFALADNGTLAYVPSGRAHRARLAWFDRSGGSTPVLEETGTYWFPRLSPDEKTVLLQIQDEEQRLDIWTYDLERDALSRQTRGMHYFPVWWPDGRRFVTSRNSAEESPDNSLVTKRLQGSGEAELFLEKEYTQYAVSFSPDGAFLAVNETHPETGWDIWVVSVDEGTASPFLTTPAAERTPMFSPDGRWIAYRSDATGGAEIWVSSFPDGETQQQVSTNGGHSPRWARDGNELFYAEGEQIMTVSIDASEELRISKPRPLFRVRGLMVNYTNYDVSADGQRFIAVQQESSEQREIHVALDWHYELERLTSTDP